MGKLAPEARLEVPRTVWTRVSKPGIELVWSGEWRQSRPAARGCPSWRKDPLETEGSAHVISQEGWKVLHWPDRSVWELNRR